MQHDAVSQNVQKVSLEKGGFVARFARDPADMHRSQALRYRCFIQGAGASPRPMRLEQDPFDTICDHVLIEDTVGTLMGSFRVLPLASGASIGASYSAQFYNLAKLADYSDPMLELGRFCVSPQAPQADVVRLAWGMLARIVDARGAGLLFGCSSFAGIDPARYGLAFDLLAARHLAPARWAPDVSGAEAVRYAQAAAPVADHAAAVGQVPALLKTYLTMGGWVSDHAVVDRDLNTLHVFTGLEIAAIPAARAAALRAIAVG